MRIRLNSFNNSFRTFSLEVWPTADYEDLV